MNIQHLNELIRDLIKIGEAKFIEHYEGSYYD